MNKPKQHTSRGPTTAIWKTLTLCRAAGSCRWMILCEHKGMADPGRKKNTQKKYFFPEDKNRKPVIVHYNCAARRLGDPYRSAASSCVCLSEMCMTFTDRLWGTISITWSWCVGAVHAAAESEVNTHFGRQKGRWPKHGGATQLNQQGPSSVGPTCSTGGATERGFIQLPFCVSSQGRSAGVGRDCILFFFFFWLEQRETRWAQLKKNKACEMK